MFAPMVPKSARVGKNDRSYIRIDPAWLADETILSATVTTDDPFITIGATDISSNEIGFMRTGVSIGIAIVHISLLTSGNRSDCKNVRIKVEDC